MAIFYAIFFSFVENNLLLQLECKARGENSYQLKFGLIFLKTCITLVFFETCNMTKIKGEIIFSFSSLIIEIQYPKHSGLY